MFTVPFLATPVPKDIPLPLPLPEWLLVILLVFSFILHIIFINMMVGGSIITLWAEIRGLRKPHYDIFAKEVAKTITVNKSLAVVLGVAPLLSINTLYTVYFYSANALTGFAWIMIIPLVTIAFLLTYLHKYTWNSLADQKWLHISIIAAAVLIFLSIPLIFLTNVNLMMFPEHWGKVQGFFTALFLPNVLPRYFEFLGACLSVTGIFIIWYNHRKQYPVESLYQGVSRRELKNIGYKITIIGLAIQILFGGIVLLTLPSNGMGFNILLSMFSAGLLLVLALWFSYKSLLAATDKYFGRIAFCMLAFMVIYGASRQMYRARALDKHRLLVAAHTANFQKASKEARLNPVEESVELEIDPSLGEVAKGAAIFKSYCGACHKEKEVLVGPPILEMSKIYAGKEDALHNWIKAPGKKRENMPQMPGFPQLSSDELKELSKYILSIK